jgi:hypothetical protein
MSVTNLFKIRSFNPSMVIHTYNPNNREAEAEGLGVQGQHGLYSKTLSQNKQINKYNKISLH